MAQIVLLTASTEGQQAIVLQFASGAKDLPLKLKPSGAWPTQADTTLRTKISRRVV